MSELKDSILKARAKRMRIRTIYLNHGKTWKFKGWSDFVLLNTIVNELKVNNCAYSKKEIYSAFREVSRDDYDKNDKRALLKTLLSKACINSPF
jgi:hypothetical protein